MYHLDISIGYMLNLHHLAVFHAVAVTESVSRGAEQLLISQPAVSKQLKQLEQSLNVQLVDRHAKGICLTAAGQLLNDYAARIFALSAEAQAALDDLSSLGRGSLSVGAGPTVGIYLLPRALVEFRRQFPSIRLHVETEGPHLLRQRLVDGILDFGLSEAPITSDDLQSRIFMTDLLVPIAAPNHQLANRKSVRAQDFCREPFIARETGAAGMSLVERSLAQRGLEVEPILTVGSTEAIKQAVTAGLGVAMVSRLAIRTEIAAHQLVELPVKGISIRYPIYHVWRKEKSRSNAAKIFLKMLEDFAKSQK